MIRAIFVMAALTGCVQLIGVEDSTELRLERLDVSTGVLMPAFDPDITSYTVTLPYAGPKLAVTASAEASVSLSIDGESAQRDVPRMIDAPIGDIAIEVALRTTSGVERVYTVMVRRADLDLAFGAPQIVYGLTDVYAVQRADVNSDAVDDLVVTGTDGSVGTFVNDGAGEFTSISTAFLPGLNPRALAVTDLSGDGIGDLVVANGSLVIANGRGDGSYHPPTPVGALWEVSAFSIGRINADGIDDIAAGNGTGLVTPVFGVTTVTGNDWSFTQIVGEPRILRLARMNGPKLVALNTTEHVIIVMSLADPSMRWPYPLESQAYPSDLLVADLDGDMQDDIVFLDAITGTVTILSEFPTWKRTQITVAGHPRALAIADLDSDGHLDLAMTAGDDLVVLRNDGIGIFEQRRFANMVDTPAGFAIGDFNHDGRNDLIFAFGTQAMTMALGEQRQ
ncbi:MAG: FG-GAP-like repeat-containing protein [Kofleriaceae bacterium]